MRLTSVLLTLGIAFVARPERSVEVGDDALFIGDPAALVALEARGLDFMHVVGEAARAELQRTIEKDIAELTANPPPNDPRRAFRAEWLARGAFELTGVVNRIDRRRFEPAACGEVRLVYRLALTNEGRATTRLPMTVNVRVPQPRDRGERDCKTVAERWLARPDAAALVAALPPPAQIEINYQSTHTPAFRTDMDDSAEYVMRSFVVRNGRLTPDGLFDTPRPDADPAALVRWIASHLEEIDAGTFTLPPELLAERVDTVSPRGLERTQNRPWASLVDAEALRALPLASLAHAKTPELLLRRLDEATCAGCHQTRGVAGFHLLGEDRGTSTFNAIALGPSPHFAKDLRWRRSDLLRAARGEPVEARPFASFPDGKIDSDCGLARGYEAWGCEPGLVCRDVHHGALGLCARAGSTLPGATCEDVSFVPDPRPEGPVVTAKKPDAACPAPTGAQKSGAFCAPNWLGFTGGMCSERCKKVGERRGDAICAALPSAGYEADCFFSNEPIERCLSRHLVTAWVQTCDADHLCRPDYGCARVAGAPKGTGACVPPYFIFQARVDGPRLDR
ncbi:MAG: hypothetical protein KIT84_32075 [Labilithrix sp.]|nr:hypothetical protein [Labilithrix sp.]MCW5815710.1 hypothetical protein [Labilithrix sp.]